MIVREEEILYDLNFMLQVGAQKKSSIVNDYRGFLFM